MVKAAPAIDVLLPVFNAAETLDETLASIAAQTFADFRVLMIDDGSTDASAALLAEWTRRDPRFVTLTKRNSGIVDALNLGLARSTAPIIARMDADDLARPERFAVQRAFLENNPGFVAVGCRVQHIDEHGRMIAGFPQPGDPGDCDPKWIPAREPYIIHPFLMARRDAMAAAGGYRHVPNSEDSDLFWRLRALGRLQNLPEILGSYRLHSGSISSGSVVGGRAMAVGSQLGALSARRRAAGDADILFSRPLLATLRQAGSLDAMCRAVASLAGDGEMPHLKLAAGIKLLELGLYRPYRLAIEDCNFIRQAFLAHAERASPHNRREMLWYITVTGSRLLRRGRIREALALVPPAAWGTTVFRAARRD